MIRFIYGIVPVSFEVTTDLPDGVDFDAIDGTLTVKVRPGCATDEPRIQHELEHKRQQVRRWFPWARQRSWLDNEVDAYRAQLRYYPASEREARIVELAYDLRDPVYGFPLTQEEAEARLRA